MLSKVEEEHKSKLQQLDSIKVKQDSFFQGTDKPTPNANFDPFNLNGDTNSFATLNGESNSNTSCLSLQEKERIATQKDQQRRLNNEAPLIPQPKPLVSGPGATCDGQMKDLTNTLINANLNMLPNRSIGNDSSKLSNLASFNSISTFSTLSKPPNEQFASIKPNMSPFDSLVLPNLSQKGTAQSLNTLKNSSGNGTLLGNSLQSSTLMSTSLNASPMMGHRTQPSKQLSKSELDEFLN